MQLESLGILIIFLSTLSYIINTFQFRSVSVNPQQYTINTLTTYHFFADRTINNYLANTNWNNELVLQTSKVIITFPDEYIVENYSCNSITFTTNVNIFIPTNYNCSISGKTVEISNLFSSNLYIANFTISITNILNPSPAINTNNFIIQIGSDVSENSTEASITLQPTKFSQVSATFNPKTVNTTGFLILSFITKINIPAYSNLIIKVPTSLTWTRQISLNYRINLNSNFTCLGITTNVNSNIICSGDPSNFYIVLYNFTSEVILTQSKISLKVGQLYSPPTLQIIDSLPLIISSPYLGQYYQLISQSTLISGLTVKTMSVNIIPLSTMIVNSKIGIQVQMTLADTINQNDQIRLTFPLQSSFTYSFVNSNTTNFTLNSSYSYDSSKKVLLLRQRTTTQINFAPRVITIGLTFFTAPPSIKSFSIKTQILRNGFQMTEGFAVSSAVLNTYSGIISSNYLKINGITNYSILLTLKDDHTQKMTIQIILPKNLKIQNTSTFSVLTNISSFIPTLTIDSNNNQKISLTNFTQLSTNIIAQTINITLLNLINPSSVQSINNFQIKTFYTQNSEEQVSFSNISASNIFTIHGDLQQQNIKISTSSIVNYQICNYTFQIKIENQIEKNGYLIIKFPISIMIKNIKNILFKSSITYLTQSILNFSINITQNSIKVINNITGSFLNSQILIFKFIDIRNPSSTKSTTKGAQGFQISSFNSLNQVIDILPSNNSLFIQTNKVNSLSEISFNRTSSKNQEKVNFTFNLKQIQNFEINNKIILLIDSTIILTPSLVCIDVTTSLALNCSFLTSFNKSLPFNSVFNSSNYQYVSIFIPSTYVNTQTLIFNLINLTNPSSYAPFNFYLITSDQNIEYFYSSGQSLGTYSNNLPSMIQIKQYTFTVRQLKQLTNLNIWYKSVNSIFKLQIQFPSEFLLNSSIINCQSLNLNVVCSLKNSTILEVTQINNLTLTNQFNLTIKNIRTPSSQISYPLIIAVTSYNQKGFQMGFNNTAISYSLACKLPCKKCAATNISLCQSCYLAPLNLNQILFNNTCYQTCPSGYIKNENLFTCQACQLPCLTCQNSVSFCTSCNQTSQFIYIFETISNSQIISSTCTKKCPSKFYPDTNFLPIKCKACVSPCSECTSQTFCLSCSNSSLYLYDGKCITSCPANISVQSTTDKTCLPCNKQCNTCSLIVSNCTSCSNISILYEGNCILQCPSNLLHYNNTCTKCDSLCLTCSITPSNCTSCVKNSSNQYFHENQCLQKCPTFYYTNSSNSVCLSCSNLTTHCKDCLNETFCNSCDNPYVLLNGKCLSQVPVGYINISGVAYPCEGDCKTCIGTVQNCTSCKTLNLNGNLCQSSCDFGQTSIDQICQICKYPCQTCSGQIYTCNSCYTNSSTFLYQNQCLLTCPQKYYSDPLTSKCLNCQSPCEKCINSQSCLSCLIGFNFYSQNNSCLSFCPEGMIGQNRTCVLCQNPCKLCTQTKNKCTSCINDYFLNSNQCVQTCPVGTIKNQTIFICDKCISPCLTCQNQTDICLTCIIKTYFFQNQCLTSCPEKYFISLDKCKSCVQPCVKCTSQNSCISCVEGLLLYNKTCVVTCPQNSGKVINNTCVTCDTGCYKCQDTGKCIKCYSNYILFQNSCLNNCPTNYTETYENSTKTCKKNTTPDAKLQKSLSKSSILPLPFSIFGLMILGAGIISKLQNQHTYFLGFAYSIFGILQTGCCSYLLYSYLQSQLNQKMFIYIFIAGLGVIYLLNFISIIIKSYYLSKDKKFLSWKKGSDGFNGSCLYIINIISLLISFKFKMILFSRIFNFGVFRCELESVQKFKIFNLFSFLGIISQTTFIYIILKFMITEDLGSSSIFLVFVDALIIVSLNICFSIISSHKSQNFFQQKIDGFILNKKITIQQDLINKQALKDHEQFYPYYSTRKTGFQSQQKLNQDSIVIQQCPDQFSLQIQERKNQSNDDHYFQQADLSSQTLRYKDQLNQKKIKNKKQTKKQEDNILQFQTGSNSIKLKEKQNNKFRKIQLEQISLQSSSIQSKKSENIYSISHKKKNSSKKSKKIFQTISQNGQNIKKVHKNDNKIEQSATQFNIIQKQNQLRQNLQNGNYDKNNKLQKQFENNKDKNISYNFLQMEKSLYQGQNSVDSQNIEDSSKKFINSTHSSKTDLLVVKPPVSLQNRQINSQAQTLQYTSKLKPEKVAQVITQAILQEKTLSKDMNYKGQQNQVNQEILNKKDSKFSKNNNQSLSNQPRYQKIQINNNQKQLRLKSLVVQNNQLISSDFQRSQNQIEDHPYGHTYKNLNAQGQFQQQNQDQQFQNLELQLKEFKNIIQSKKQKNQKNRDLLNRSKTQKIQFNNKLIRQIVQLPFNSNLKQNQFSNDKYKSVNIQQENKTNKNKNDLLVNLNSCEQQKPLNKQKNKDNLIVKQSKKIIISPFVEKDIETQSDQIQNFRFIKNKQQIPRQKSRQFVRTGNKNDTQQTHLKYKNELNSPQRNQNIKNRLKINKSPAMFSISNNDQQKIDKKQQNRNLNNFSSQIINYKNSLSRNEFRRSIHDQQENDDKITRKNAFISNQGLPKPSLNYKPIYESFQKKNNLKYRQLKKQKSFDSTTSKIYRSKIVSAFNTHQSKPFSKDKKVQKGQPRNQPNQLQKRRLKQLQKIYLQKLH